MKDYDWKAHLERDPPPAGVFGWVQWKGTNVCMDLHCHCGCSAHVDQDYFYFYECPSCHQRYQVSQIVRLVPLSPEQQPDPESFKTSTDWEME